MNRLSSIRYHALIFSMLLAFIASIQPVAAASFTEIYNPRFWGQATVGNYTAPSLSLSTVAGGVYTNAGTTNTFSYRIYGTNSLGRTPISAQTNITFAESTGSAAVAISWGRVDGVSGYVLEKSYNGGTSWTNHFHYGAPATNATDWQYSSFSDGSNAATEIAPFMIPWLTNGSPGTWTNLSDYNNDIPGNSTNLSEFNNDIGFLTNEPIFLASVAYGIVAAATTPWDTAATDASVATNSIATIQASTSLWNTAASDASSATGTIAVIQLSTGAWTKAASDAETATNAIPRITELEGRTNAWNTAATDASTATNETTTLRGATNALDTRLTAHVTNEIPHVSIDDRANWNGKATLADVAGVGYFTNMDLSGWSSNRATNSIYWAVYRDGIDITSTGALSPDVSGVYVYSHVTNNFDHSADRVVYVCTNGYMLHPGNFIGSDTYRICATTSEIPYIYISSSTNPATVYTEVSDVSTGAPSGSVAVAASTNIVSIGQDTAAPDNLIVTGNLVVASVQLGTNTPATNWPSSATQDLSFTNDLIAATNALNTRVGNLESATNSINTRVSALETPFQPWVSIIPDAGATATVTYAAGPLVEIVATNSPTTITFDNSAFPTSGVCSVNLEIYAGTNSIAFVSGTITNSAAPTISTSSWTSIFYRKVGTNSLWKGRN